MIVLPNCVNCLRSIESLTDSKVVLVCEEIFEVLKFYLLLIGVEDIFSWLMGVELRGAWLDMILVRIGVEFLDSRGVESILFLSDIGPCIWDDYEWENWKGLNFNSRLWIKSNVHIIQNIKVKFYLHDKFMINYQIFWSSSCSSSSSFFCNSFFFFYCFFNFLFSLKFFNFYFLSFFAVRFLSL